MWPLLLIRIWCCYLCWCDDQGQAHLASFTVCTAWFFPYVGWLMVLRWRALRVSILFWCCISELWMFSIRLNGVQSIRWVWCGGCEAFSLYFLMGVMNRWLVEFRLLMFIAIWWKCWLSHKLCCLLNRWCGLCLLYSSFLIWLPMNVSGVRDDGFLVVWVMDGNRR